MKTKIQIEDNYGIKLSIKRKVSKITKLLFKIEEVKNNSAVYGFDFDTLAFDILFVDDKTIHSINKEYRKKDSPTDVITFALFADDDNKLVINKTIELGEIIISIDTAIKQAQKSLEEEVLTLICHGVLHLIGFDHLTEEDYNFIVRIQDSVLKQL